MRLTRIAFLASTLLSSPVWAGEEVIYAPAPGWVSEAGSAEVVVEDGPAQVLWDWQHRLEGSTVYSYTDRAIRIDNPESQMEQNQLTLSWLPDKGDLTVHRLELYRDGEVLDLIADGVEFEVLRRETGLEQRLLDGELTATVSVPGLRVGDVLRISHSTSTDDQALGDEVQALQFLYSEPWQVGSARTIMSWPADAEMYWRAEDRVELADPVERDGYRYLTVDMPLAEAPPMPIDAPSRYLRPPVLRVGSFASWAELSAVMDPHYAQAATLAEDSPIRDEVARIMAASDDPQVRAAMAVQLVQEEVSYLLDGLDGGNYLPQDADQTWEMRYGDCKAKTVLLLSMLQAMGIEAEAVLVATQGGDAVPELLPLPAAFNHVIVHAVIEGKDYWLDGTMTGTRLATLSDVPPFHFALPIRRGGADLMPITPRAPEQLQMTMAMQLDHTAGVDFPALFSMEIRLVGPSGTPLRAMADEENPAMLRQLAQRFSNNDADMIVSNLALEYDEQAALATIRVEGISQPSFEWREGRLRTDAEGLDEGADFNPDRARRAWRDIPVATQGPAFQRIEMNILLPENGAGFTLEGPLEIEAGYGNLTASQQVSLVDGAMQLVSDVVMLPGEIAPEDLSQARRDARRLSASTLELMPPEQITWRWELEADERARRAAPIRAAYDAAIEFAEEDDFLPLQWRAFFNLSIYDYEAALADFDILVEEDPSLWAYQNRAAIYRALGRDDAAIADLQLAYDLNSENGVAMELARRLAYLGRLDEAQDLLDLLPVSEDERVGFADVLASVVALDGDVDSGFALIAASVADQPQNSTALNGDCWFRGLFNHQLDTALARCTQAVERAGNPAAALDSRALVYFREGNLDAALDDLNTVLNLAPALAESRYLRGIVRLHAGDEAGEQDIAEALLMAPYLRGFYETHGIAPPR